MVLCALLWSGCGGGGGGGGGAADTPTPRRTATSPANSATPTLTPTATPNDTTPLPTPTDTAIATPTDVAPPATATLTSSPEPTETPVPEPTATPTSTPLIGPIVTAFGTADSTGTFNQPIDTDPQGRPVYSRVGGDNFIIYVEGRPGVSRLPVAMNLLSTQAGNPMGQPDLQMVSSNDFGDGSSAVCDESFPTLGGVPAVDPPDFGFVQSVSDALNDLSCRFKVYQEADFACTQDGSGTFIYANGGSTIQFCTLVNDSLTLPTGDTVLSVRLRDTAARAGPTSQIVVRVR